MWYLCQTLRRLHVCNFVMQLSKDIRDLNRGAQRYIAGFPAIRYHYYG